MRGETTIEFDGPFQYSKDGEFLEATSVTVRAPGLGKKNVHFAMDAYVNEMAMYFDKRNREAAMAAKAHGIVSTDEDDEDEADDEDEDDKSMFLMSVALGPDRYPAFVNYVQSSLTNSKKLAVVTGTDVPVTEAVWDAIESAHGMNDGVMRVLGGFTGFFVSALGAQKKSGSSSRAKSSSATKARSATKK